MTSHRARGRPSKSSYKNTNLHSPVNNLRSMVSYFPRHRVRKSRAETITVAVKTWHRLGSEDSETLLGGLTEKKSSRPQWIRRKKSSVDKETQLRWLMEKISSLRIGEKKCIDLMEKKSSLPQWIRRKRSMVPKFNEQLKNTSRTSKEESSLSIARIFVGSMDGKKCDSGTNSGSRFFSRPR